MHWLYEAKKRFGICILNYVVTSNHIHLLVFDSKPDVMAKSIQWVAGRTGPEYNQRKSRKGAYWEDRYHATAVETGCHLIQCLVDIDLNMVRAAVVEHPSQWSLWSISTLSNKDKKILSQFASMVCNKFPAAGKNLKMDHALKAA